MEDTVENSQSPKDSGQKAKKLKEDIKSLEKELKEIQGSCNHPDYKLMNCPSEFSTFSLKKVCVTCDKEIGYPSQQEVDSWAKG